MPSQDHLPADRAPQPTERLTKDSFLLVSVVLDSHIVSHLCNGESIPMVSWKLPLSVRSRWSSQNFALLCPRRPGRRAFFFSHICACHVAQTLTPHP